MSLYKYTRKAISVALLSIVSLSYSSSINADETENHYNYNRYLHDKNFTNYAEAGDLLWKIRGFYTKIDAKNDFKTDAITGTAPEKIAMSSYGFDSSATFLLHKFIAFEAAAGLNIYNLNKKYIEDVYAAYNNDSTKKIGEYRSSNIYNIPVTGIFQLSIPLFDAGRIYAGIGGHATYMFTTSKAFRVESNYGAVWQVGVDMYPLSDFIVSIDMKKYNSKSSMFWDSAFLNGTSDVESKVKWSPMTIGLSVGIRH